MTREVAALIAQMPFILYALLSLAVVIAVPHSQWNLLAVAAPYFLGPTISKRYTTLRDATVQPVARVLVVQRHRNSWSLPDAADIAEVNPKRVLARQFSSRSQPRWRSYVLKCPEFWS